MENAYAFFTDDDLFTLFRKGDQLAYTEIYNRYEGVLQIHAYRKLGDYEDVKDVMQELFTNLWVKRAELPQTSNLSGYLYTALRNRIFDLMSHKQVANKYTQSLQHFIGQGQYLADQDLREKELKALIQKEIDALPAKMREVFILSRHGELSHKEIAEKLNISEQTVSKQITNALKILRTKLGVIFFTFFLSGIYLFAHSSPSCTKLSDDNMQTNHINDLLRQHLVATLGIHASALPDIDFQQFISELAVLIPEGPAEDYFFIQSEGKGKLCKINLDEIVYMESMLNYLRIHLSKESHLTYLTMKMVEDKLPAKKFIRVHKSFIINIDKMVALDGNTVRLSNGESIVLGKQYRKPFFDRISNLLWRSKRAS